MQKRKFTKKEITALVALIVLMVAVVTVGAVLIINNVNTANQNAANTQHTTVDSTVLTDNNPSDTNSDYSENTKSDNKSLDSKNSSSKSDSKDIKTNKNNSSSGSSSTKSKTPTKSSGSNKKPNSPQKPNVVETVAPNTNPTHASNEVCKINGKKCYVGDTITIVLNIKTPKVLENFQGTTTYDSSFLKYESSKSNVNGIVNNSGDCIYYNGSDIGRGFDFTNTGSIYYATFKVLKTGSTKIENSIKVLSDKNSKPVSVDDCKISINIFD